MLEHFLVWLIGPDYVLVGLSGTLISGLIWSIYMATRMSQKARKSG